MSSSNWSFLTCIQVSQEAGQMICYSHLFQNFPQFIVIHTVKGFGIVNKAEIDVFFWNSLSFSMIQQMLAILISGSSAFSKTSLNIWKFTVLKWHLSYYISARPNEGLDFSHLFSLLQTLLSLPTSFFLHQMCILQGTTLMFLADDLPTHTHHVLNYTCSHISTFHTLL